MLGLKGFVLLSVLGVGNGVVAADELTKKSSQDSKNSSQSTQQDAEKKEIPEEELIKKSEHIFQSLVENKGMSSLDFDTKSYRFSISEESLVKCQKDADLTIKLKKSIETVILSLYGNKIKEYVGGFCFTLHKNTIYRSNVLRGDVD